MTEKRRKKRKVDPQVILVIVAAVVLAAVILAVSLGFLFKIMGKEETSGEQPEIKVEEQKEEEALPEEEDPQSEENQPQSETGAETEITKILVSENTQETAETTLGIDVAKYQGTIDWKQVADSGVDFAMVRVGYRTQKSGEIVEDTNARYNMQEAAANGLHVGAYFFSTAVTKEEAVEEAKWVADYIS